MVAISPISTTTKPAPARSRTSRIGRTWPVGAPSTRRVGGEGILGFGDADRQMAVARRLQLGEALQHRSVGGNVARAIDFARDGVASSRSAAFRRDRAGGSAPLEPSAIFTTARASASAPAAPLPQDSLMTASTPHFSRATRWISASSASVSLSKRLIATTTPTPNLPTFSTWRSRLARPFSSAARFSLPRSTLGDAAVHFQRARGRDDDRRGGLQARLPALDVEEFLRPEIGAEAGFGHDIIGEPQRRARRDDASCSRARYWRTGRRG